MVEELNSIIDERFEVGYERILEIKNEDYGDKEMALYFRKVAEFIVVVKEYYRFVESKKIEEEALSVLEEWNQKLYADILKDNYEKSYANPSYAVERLGENLGAICSTIVFEIRSIIIFAAENKKEELLIRIELFLEIYGMFSSTWKEEKKRPSYEAIQQVLYWYISDYSEISEEERIKKLLLYKENFSTTVLEKYKKDDYRYLYYYGEYISQNEIKMAEFMASLPKETISLMADIYTEGYRKGFELAGKNLAKKKTVEIIYPIGFEPMVIKAIQNFKKLGLEAVIRRSPCGLLQNAGLAKLGVIGANPNKQYDFDHKDDKAICFDKGMVQRKLEVLRNAFEQYKEEASWYAGPAVIETFGEEDFVPLNKKECFTLDKEQQKLFVDLRAGSGEIQREYILDKERSFTIIAFPIPEIGENFKEIFEDTIKINTLDYKKYERMQQKIIDILDQATKVEIKGMNGNITDLTISLFPLKNEEKETIFENCVADVNIPVGEVFTSPVLKGTNGVLNVTKVFLNGLEYKNIKIVFEDGMIKEYDCENFETREENKKYIKDNILFQQETLPLGEFAIGTNTTAYMMAKQWGIESKLPILIAEKMGPHFAVGDTCYSHSEDIKVYNPNGKEIVAKDNEISMKRNSNIKEAYFNCHTDITIPYSELGSLSAIKEDGTKIEIIKESRFVLPGCEELNKPFEE